MAYKLHHLEIHPAETGHIVEHHFEAQKKGNAFMERPEPEKHVFGDGEGEEMLTHVASTLGIKHEGEMAAEEEEAGKAGK